ILTALGPSLQTSDYRVRIKGHTDARPFPKGSDRTNWDLSYERAAEARKVLAASGFSESAIVGVYALGSSALLDPKNPEAAVNRRLTLLAIPKEMKAPKKKGKSNVGPTGMKPVETLPVERGVQSPGRKNFERALKSKGASGE